MRNKIDWGTIKGSGSNRMCMGGIGGMLYFTLPLVSYWTLIGLLGLLVESDQTARTLLRLKQLVQKKEEKNNLEPKLSLSSDFIKLLMPWRNLNKNTD
jgi:hypothetical protein